MFSKSRKNRKPKIHYVEVPRKGQNYLPLIVITMIITLIICISVDNVPVGSKKMISGQSSRVVKMIDTGIHTFQKRIQFAKKRVNKYLTKKTNKKYKRSIHHKKS